MIIPALALRGNAILPGMIAHLDVGRAKSISAVEKAMLLDQEIFMVAQQDPDIEDPDIHDLYRIGTLCHIRQIVKMPKNQIRIMVEGIVRARMEELTGRDDYLEAAVERLEDEEYPDALHQEALLQELKVSFSTYASLNEGIGPEVVDNLMIIEELDYLVEKLGAILPLEWEKRQQLLEALTLAEQAECLCLQLRNEASILSIRHEIGERLKDRLDQNQKDYVLREQLKLIREELGEEGEAEADKFEEAVDKLEASDEVKNRIREEIKRFRGISSQTPEYAVGRTYISTLLKMPWDKRSADNDDLSYARDVLDQDHYGLEKAKERILEFLAVRKLTGKSQASILCLVGPPGTGKTSIGKSIAKALGREYVRLSLGGVHDEAEVRGHRRTYVGAMPGRIATALKTAGVKNPVIVLDEIDKLSASYKGETASAMLEVLDAEQNNKFEDHYIEIPIDLSEVFFVTTANDPSAIPQPLYDRMDVIEISSYTENEKFHIAKEHLLPKQIESAGLTPKQLTVSDKALTSIIGDYTREAGVRSLERRIGSLCRKAARIILEEGKKKVSVTDKKLVDFLGQPVHTVNRVNETDEVGIVRGLAWTAMGGETLEVEVNLMPGEGEFILTGQLGDVMKESAQAGTSYIRSAAKELGIEDEAFRKQDIHIHIPEGAVPKDGPSAGVTMITAMVSAFTNRPVYANVAMTGEITLRGRVLPIGGLKEKLLAAKKAGITKVLVPEANKRDVKEISSEITDGLTILYMTHVSQVLKEALVKV
ncbi:MAG: endopeptidase La [Lachnospiraceae bacterium]|nr:endopeptidase La [Lachnospiraceae bacterium]